jgi:hypothetical protein
MQGMFSLFFADVTALFRSVGIHDLIRWALYACWPLILFLPLKAIDRRDSWTALGYMLTMAAYATVIFVAMPASMGMDRPLNIALAVVCVSVAIAAARWFVGLEKAEEVIVTKIQEAKKEDSNGKAGNRKEGAKAA